jgi:hypothetical protein
MLLRLRYRKFMVKYLFLFVAASTCLTGMAGAEEPVVSEAQPVVAEAAAVAPEAVADSGPSVELLDLRQAQELALRDNPSLQAIEARVGQAQQRVAQARSAYFPQANVEYQATHTDLPDNTVNGLREQAWRQVLPNAAQASLFGGIAPPTALGAFSGRYRVLRPFPEPQLPCVRWFRPHLQPPGRKVRCARMGCGPA